MKLNVMNQEISVEQNGKRLTVRHPSNTINPGYFEREMNKEIEKVFGKTKTSLWFIDIQDLEIKGMIGYYDLV